MEKVSKETISDACDLFRAESNLPKTELIEMVSKYLNISCDDVEEVYSCREMELAS